MVDSSFFGYFGGLLLSVQMIPQIIKVGRTMSAKDLSYVYLMLNLVGLQSMAIYGIIENDKPLYIPAGVSGMNTVMLLILKILCDRKESMDLKKVSEQCNV
jgi:MtN3 and saliva related transmembrane protein